MTRWFCDRCGKELRAREHSRLCSKRIEGRFDIEVITGVGGTWNAGLLCHDCIRALVAKTGDARDE
ncbi:MAG: hypothetical protein ABFC80_08105 [Coriobacteriales bacterium]